MLPIRQVELPKDALLKMTSRMASIYIFSKLSVNIDVRYAMSASCISEPLDPSASESERHRCASLRGPAQVVLYIQIGVGFCPFSGIVDERR